MFFFYWMIEFHYSEQMYTKCLAATKNTNQTNNTNKSTNSNYTQVFQQPNNTYQFHTCEIYINTKKLAYEFSDNIN